MANTHIRFNNDHDDGDDYNESESDEEFTSNEKELLKKVQRNEQSDSDGEDEVFGVGSDSEDDDLHKSDLAESDIEGQEDEDLPDVRAWGKDKRKYYSTDYVDPDYGGFQGKDATLAELEEEEARNLQKQLVQQMDDDDFALDIFGQSQPDAKKTSEEVVKTDISKLSKRQKLEILKKESPELFGLLDDFKAKLAVAKDYLRPIIQLSKKNKIKPCKALQFVKIDYKLILNYCTNIQMYLLLKSSKVNVRNHPIAKRLYQYRQLLAQLESPYNEIIKPQLEMLLLENTEDQQETKKKTLNVLKKLSKHNAPVTDMEVSLPPRKKKKVSKADLPMVNSNVEGSENQDNSKNEEDMHKANAEHKETVESSSDVNAKRGITFEIAKNKGLTPHRKKEQRNPRVKHRMKFKKAKIRRKGAVREVRREISRYDGEISGIKASVTKSVKIKS